MKLIEGALDGILSRNAAPTGLNDIFLPGEVFSFSQQEMASSNAIFLETRR